jgi:hypothetical protein
LASGVVKVRRAVHTSPLQLCSVNTEVLFASQHVLDF